MAFFKHNGYLEKKEFIDKKSLEKLENLYNHELNNTNANVVKVDFINLNRYEILNKINQNFIKLIRDEIKIDIVLRNIWLQKSNFESIHNSVPYIPHIDKKRYFKIFLYLNDVDKENGPLNVCTNANIRDNEFKRKSWWKKVEGKSRDQINKEDNHGLVFENENLNFKSVCLPAGSIVALDTNCPHFAGKIKEGFDRKILRFNFFSSFENSHDINFKAKKLFLNISKIVNYYKNL